VPAAAVIPAPIAYIKVVAVKKLVVEPRLRSMVALGNDCGPELPSGEQSWHLLAAAGNQDVYFEKIRVFKAGNRLNTLAWNNKIGLWIYFVGF
jgi:hypothetical protein